MIKGFVSTYKDEDDFVHLYFFPGIDDDDNKIYNDIDLSNCGVDFVEEKFNDNACDFRFVTKNIIKITCKLVKQDGNIDYNVLYI